MRLYSLASTPFTPVSHNPELKKQVLMPEPLSCVRHISHLKLSPGSTAVEHSHNEASEVFYCTRGAIVFRVSGKEVSLNEGSCLIVEPGESHAIVEVPVESEMVYFLTIGK